MLKKILKVLLALVALLVVVVVTMIVYASATHGSRTQFPDTPYPSMTASTDPELIERGRCLVHGPAHCSQCHSTTEREHPEKIKTSPLSGGLEFPMGPIATTWSANLTSDP